MGAADAPATEVVPPGGAALTPRGKVKPTPPTEQECREFCAGVDEELTDPVVFSELVVQMELLVGFLISKCKVVLGSTTRCKQYCKPFRVSIVRFYFSDPF